MATWRAESLPGDDPQDIRWLQFCEDHTYVYDFYHFKLGLNRSWFYYDVRNSNTLIMTPLGTYRHLPAREAAQALGKLIENGRKHTLYQLK